MSVRRIAVLAALAFITIATPAAAVTDVYRLSYAPADTYPELGASLPIARAMWPDSPCRDREQITWTSGGVSIHEGDAFEGWAWDTGCAVILDESLVASPPRLCELLAHEFGHLAGRGHSDDPADVMYPDVPRVAQCDALGE